jgi:hypothetical protein
MKGLIALEILKQNRVLLEQNDYKLGFYESYFVSCKKYKRR